MSTERVVSVAARFGDWLRRQPPFVLAVVVVAIVLVKNGVGELPVLDRFVRMSADVTTAPNYPPGALWVLGSPLGALVTFAVGLGGSRLGYVAIHAGLSLLFPVVLLSQLRRVYGGATTALVATALLATPATAVLATWVGTYDVFTLGAASVLALASSPVLLFPAALVLGFNAFEQAVFMIPVLLVVRWALGRPLRWAWVLGAMVVGRLTFVGYHAVFEIHSGVDRFGYIRLRGWDRYITSVLAEWWTLVYSLLGAGWVWVILTIVDLPKRRMRAISLALIAAVLPIGVSLDPTRVYALIVWPSLLALAVWAGQHFEEEELSRIIGLGGLLAIAIPQVIVWDGGVYTSTWGPIVRSWLS